MKKTHQVSNGASRCSYPRVVTAVATAAALFLAPAPRLQASSHSDAPLIKLDPQANLTDVYAFIRQRPTGERVLVVEVSVRPFSEPGDGSMYDAFSPDAIYSVVLSNPATGAESQRFDFQFSPSMRSVETTRT
jgi:hypothetical protein